MSNIVLIGLMGAGKTAVGRAVANRYGARFLDTDKEIEREHGVSIAQIFSERGEDEFRRIERECVVRMVAAGRRQPRSAVRHVISTGGGLPLRDENKALLLELGTVIWLRARPETIAGRVAHKLPQRPLIADHAANLPGRIAELYGERGPHYEKLANIIVNTDRRQPGASGNVGDYRLSNRISASRRTDKPMNQRVAQSKTTSNHRKPRAEVAAAMSEIATAKGKCYDVRVKLDQRSYDIQVQRGLMADIGATVLAGLNIEPGHGRTAAVFINPKVEHYYGKGLYASLEKAGFTVLPVVLVAGEGYKTLQTVRRVYTRLYEKAVDRRTLVIAVGGGVIGDVAGYVAATYQRGLDFIQVPTTLLAQVDSSVGGKVGVNFESAKNLVGAFYQPKLVLIDPNTLSSLPFRERRSGLAEIIKYGAIADAEFFARILQEVDGMLRLTSEYLEAAIARSCEIKADIVSKDERDEGIRAILNFGHSVGHALEALSGYHLYRHGEAIAIGMVSACLIGEELGITDPAVSAALLEVLVAAGFPVKLDERFYVNDVIRLLAHDKKAVNGTVRFVLLESLGHATSGHVVPEETVRVALQRQRRI